MELVLLEAIGGAAGDEAQATAAAEAAPPPPPAPTEEAPAAPEPTPPAAAPDPAPPEMAESPPAPVADVSVRLRENHRYPRALKRRGIGGAGRVEVRIARDGRLLAWRLVESAGHPGLDETIARLIERTAPFPPFPPDLERESIRFSFPVRFTRR